MNPGRRVLHVRIATTGVGAVRSVTFGFVTLNFNTDQQNSKTQKTMNLALTRQCTVRRYCRRNPMTGGPGFVEGTVVSDWSGSK